MEKCPTCGFVYANTRTMKQHHTTVHGESLKADESWRNTPEWRQARAAASERDNHTCQECGSTEDVAVHHIVDASKGGDKFALDNLRTLCEKCHYEEHGWTYREPSRL